MSRDAEALRREALRILAETRRDHPRHKHALDRITIRISRRLTRSAGNADPRTGVVQLSEPIFRLEENAHGYRNTVLHEIAHVIAGPEVRAHGPEWRGIFLELGGNGRRTHEFRTSGQHRRHEARCSGCGGTVELGTRRHRRLLAGARDYIHVGCGGAIIPVPPDEVRLTQAGLFPSRERSPERS
ncbi:MAG: SprT family zinc-dependent metalloprotease [Planctomycetota bacterium]